MPGRANGGHRSRCGLDSWGTAERARRNGPLSTPIEPDCEVILVLLVPRAAHDGCSPLFISPYLRSDSTLQTIVTSSGPTTTSTSSLRSLSRPARSRFSERR